MGRGVSLAPWTLVTLYSFSQIPCGRWTPRWSPQIPCLLMFISLCNTIALSVGRACDLLLKIEHGKGDRMSLSWLCHISRLEIETPLEVSWTKRPRWRSPCDKEWRWPLGPTASSGTWGWHPADSWGSSVIELLGNKTFQQPEWAWRWIPPQSSLQMRMQPSEYLRAACKTLSKRIQLAHAQPPDLYDNCVSIINCELMEVCCFRLLSLWQFCN